MVEESTAATYALRSEAGQLSDLVGRFKVDDRSADAPTRSARAA
jgi:hypothetical protein